MKSLVDFLKECMTSTVPSTPSNTLGMGNCQAPTNTEFGSGDLPNARIGKYAKYKRKKKAVRK